MRPMEVSRRADSGCALSRLGPGEFYADGSDTGPVAHVGRGLGRGPTRARPLTKASRAIDDTSHARARRARRSAALRSGRRVPETFASANSTARPSLLDAKRLWPWISGLGRSPQSPDFACRTRSLSEISAVSGSVETERFSLSERVRARHNASHEEPLPAFVTFARYCRAPHSHAHSEGRS